MLWPVNKGCLCHFQNGPKSKMDWPCSLEENTLLCIISYLARTACCVVWALINHPFLSPSNCEHNWMKLMACSHLHIHLPKLVSGRHWIVDIHPGALCARLILKSVLHTGTWSAHTLSCVRERESGELSTAGWVCPEMFPSHRAHTALCLPWSSWPLCPCFFL